MYDFSHLYESRFKNYFFAAKIKAKTLIILNKVCIEYKTIVIQVIEI